MGIYGGTMGVACLLVLPTMTATAIRGLVAARPGEIKSHVTNSMTLSVVFEDHFKKPVD